MYQFEFTGRCPSKAQIIKQIKHGLATGNWVQVTWGENQITVERFSISMYDKRTCIRGNGWIRRHGGDDLAREIEKCFQ